MNLKPRDYTYILRYYNKSIPLTRKQTINKRETKKKALRILKQKLYSCRKQLHEKKINKDRAIAICTKSVLNNKGFSPTTCKNTRKQELLCLRNNRKYTRKRKIHTIRKN
jgi:hypothetical protein